MNRITKFSLRNPLAIVIIAVLIALGGVYSASQLNRETMPNIDIPVVAIITPYPGAAPDAAYDDVTKPIEQAVRSVKGVKSVTGQSGDSISMVIAEFGYSTDMDKAYDDISTAVGTVQLPAMAVKSTFTRVSMGSAPILRASITTDKAHKDELFNYIKTEVLPTLKTIDGVGKAEVAADLSPVIRIQFDAAKLKKHGLTVSAVTDQLKAGNLSFPVGAVDLGKNTQPVRVGGTIDSVDDIKNFTIAIYPSTGDMMGDAFSGIGDGFAALGSAMGKGFSSLGQGLGAVGKMTGQTAASAGMINGIQQLQGQLVDLKLQRKDVIASIEKLDTKIANIDTQIAALNPADPNFAADMAALQADRGPLVGQRDGLKQALAGIEQGITSISQAIAGIQVQIDKNNASLKAQAKAATKTSGSASGSMSMPSTSASGSSGLNIETVTLDEIATVTYAPDAESVPSRANGEEAVLLSITTGPDANTVEVADAVRAQLVVEKKAMPGQAKVDVTYDASKAVNSSVNGMLREGLLGALFAIITILIFLKDWRTTIIVAISIPLSVLVALLSMGFMGVTLNVMTLGGLTVAIGRIVDDSIVVIENIFRNIQEGAERTPEMIAQATKEVGTAITSSTITTVAVFIPLGFTSGIIGKIFMPFALTVTVALLASLVVAIVVIPLLAKYFLLNAKIPAEHEPGRLQRAYKVAIEWSLSHKGIVIGGASLLLAGSLALVPLIGTGFVPESAEKYVNVAVTYPEGTKATTVNETMLKVENIMASHQEVKNRTVTVGGGASLSGGGPSGGGANMGGSNKGAISAKLDEDTDVEMFMAELRKEFAPLTNEDVAIAVGKLDTSGMSSSINVTVSGDNLVDIKRIAGEIVGKVKEIPNTSNVESNLTRTRKQLVVKVDDAKAAEYGLNAAMVMGTVGQYVADQDLGEVKLNGTTVDVKYGIKYGQQTAADEVGNIKMDTPTGDRVKISEVAMVENIDTPISVMTKNGTQYAQVSAVITTRDTGSVISAVKDVVADVKAPAGVVIDTGGAATMMSESFAQMGIALIVAIAGVFLCLILTFGEATAAVTILVSLPLAVIGGLVALWLSGCPLDMPALIGALMLIGIVVTNAIVFVDRVQQNMKAGMVRHVALTEAGMTRLRPILMTALATIMALIPLAAGFSEGALISQSLAVVVLGGMVSSTFLTLLVLPSVFDVFEGWKDRLAKRA